MKEITILRPSDFHLHFRDGDALRYTVTHSSYCYYSLAMPNLVSPVTTVEMALTYRERILSQEKHPTHPLMALYLTSSTTPQTVRQVALDPTVLGFKLYPRGVTTNSDHGMKKLSDLNEVFEEMEQLRVPLMIHGESSRPESDVFDREKEFIENNLVPMVEKFPELLITLEHVTSREGVNFVLNSPKNVKGTVTPQHLFLNRNHLLNNGIRPHYYCKPILKRKEDQQALVMAVTGNSEKFFLGTDSAPHAKSLKESDCGCAGSYTAPHALPLYLEIFEQNNALDRFEAFCSITGCHHYNLTLPATSDTVTLIKKQELVPDYYDYPIGEDKNEKLIPLFNGDSLKWKLTDA